MGEKGKEDKAGGVSACKLYGVLCCVWVGSWKAYGFIVFVCFFLACSLLCVCILSFVGCLRFTQLRNFLEWMRVQTLGTRKLIYPFPLQIASCSHKALETLCNAVAIMVASVILYKRLLPYFVTTSLSLSISFFVDQHIELWKYITKTNIFFKQKWTFFCIKHISNYIGKIFLKIEWESVVYWG